MRPERQSVFESVKRVREGLESHKHMPFARHALRIPEQDFYALVKLYPALLAVDPMEKTAAWEHFERGPFAEPYRVGKLVKGVIKNGVIKK